jgi:O-antigen ligase
MAAHSHAQITVLADAPVFVTADGRPRRAPRWVGRLTALVLALWIASIGVGAFGFTRIPLLPPTVAARAGDATLNHGAASVQGGVLRPIVHVRKARDDARSRHA